MGFLGNILLFGQLFLFIYFSISIVIFELRSTSCTGQQKHRHCFILFYLFLPNIFSFYQKFYLFRYFVAYFIFFNFGLSLTGRFGTSTTIASFLFLFFLILRFILFLFYYFFGFFFLCDFFFFM